MRIAATLIVAALMAVPLSAQGRGRGREAGIPPGHLPPAGLCRVWYDGLPPGRQPRPMSCREAERLARRDRYAQVIYGRDWSRDDRYAEEGFWDAARYYRQDNRRYAPRRLGRADRIYRGSDNRYYCRRDDGTSGLIVGGITGGLLGNIIARGGSKTIGTIIGAAAGAAIGKAVDEGDIVCR
jgi:hypothetical protein